MKKTLLTILSLLIVVSTVNIAYSKSTDSDLNLAIRMYKGRNYTQCYNKLNDVIKQDPSNALAYYYMAMTATQLGKREDAIANYEKAILLSSEASNLNRYAIKGKNCLENPEQCGENVNLTEEDDFVLNKKGVNFSDKVRSDYEKLKIENMMREINRSDDIAPQKFREYRDFSSMNNQAEPTNDEIVAAMRTLQRAGLANFSGASSDLALLMGTGNSAESMLNMMGTPALNPQVIQALMTGGRTFGF